MKTVILAGGLGRLAPYTTVFPKPLMPLGNRPILEIVICQLRDMASPTLSWPWATSATCCTPTLKTGVALASRSLLLRGQAAGHGWPLTLIPQQTGHFGDER